MGLSSKLRSAHRSICIIINHYLLLLEAATHAQEVYSARRVCSPTDRSHPLIIDGRDCGIEHGGLPVIGNSRAARLLNKDPRAFGAAVKQLYLSGSAGGVELRELLAYNESMDTDQPELDSGVASGGATPTLGGARDAAG